MAYATPYNQIMSRRPLYDNQRNLPEYGAIRFIYNFEEGVDSVPSMKNILFDSRTPATYSLTLQELFDGTYTAGVEADWTADAGVTATESSDDAGGSAQRVTNMNGFAQALRKTSAVAITTGNIYRIEFAIKKISGNGTFQVRVDGFSATSFDVSDSDLPTGFKPIYFYGRATAATTNIEITSDNATLSVDIAQFLIVEVSGGNHMVMDHNLYSRSGRGVNYYDFDGATQYFRIDDSRQTSLDMGTKWSCAAVVKMDANVTSVITSKWNPTGAQRGWQSFRVAQNVNRKLQTFWSQNGSSVTSQDSANNVVPAATPWVSYACIGLSFDNGTVTFYYNGVAVANGAKTGTDTSIFNNTAPAIMGMVYDAAGNPSVFMNGKIGKQIIWNGAALNAAQHTQVLNAVRSGYGF